MVAQARSAPQFPSAYTVLEARSCGKRCECQASLKRGRGNTHCPAHDDNTPSLTVGEIDGRAVYDCKADCSQEAVTEAFRHLGIVPERGSQQSQGVLRRFPYEPDNKPATFVYHVRLDVPDTKKKFWWEQEGGKKGLPPGVAEVNLPLYGHERLAEQPAAAVLLVEGERKSDVAHDHGFAAVSLCGGAAQKDFGKALHALQGRDVVLSPDNNAVGRDLMHRVHAAIRGIAHSVRWLELPELPDGGDVADYFAAGHTADELQALIAAAEPAATEARKSRVTIVTAAQLRDMPFAEPRYAVPGIIPEGLTVLAAPPKIGKSRLMIHVSLAIAAGGKVLGGINVDQGSVLYVSAEDGFRRFQSRIVQLLPDGEPWPERLNVTESWPRLDDGGIDEFEAWLDEHHDARLIVIDTLKRVRPRSRVNENAYDSDYNALQPLQELAKRRGVAVVVVHHTRKADADDPLDKISGSTGLTGVADALLILSRIRGVDNGATLLATGRDIEERSIALQRDDVLGTWRLADNDEAAEWQRSPERNDLLHILHDAGRPMTPKEVHAKTVDAHTVSANRTYGAVKYLLWQMSITGDVKAERGYYTPVAPRPAGTPNPTNRTNPTTPTNPPNWGSGEARATATPDEAVSNVDTDGVDDGQPGSELGRLGELGGQLGQHFVRLSVPATCERGCAAALWYDHANVTTWCQTHALERLREKTANA